MTAPQTIDCIITNPLPHRRAIHSGIGDRGGKVIHIDGNGGKVRETLADFMFKRIKASKGDLRVEAVRGKGQLPLLDAADERAEKPRKRDMRKGTSLKEQQAEAEKD